MSTTSLKGDRDVRGRVCKKSVKGAEMLTGGSRTGVCRATGMSVRGSRGNVAHGFRFRVRACKSALRAYLEFKRPSVFGP